MNNRPLHNLMKRHGLDAKAVAALLDCELDTVYHHLSREKSGERVVPKYVLRIIELSCK